jgi:4-carboxymuconolactone decarboxylase
MTYYDAKDLSRFGDMAKARPDLFEKFMAWYSATQQEGALGKKEKALIGLAVAHTVQCPYCIDAFTSSCLETGSDLEQMTEAVHLASAIRGGATLIHGLQMQHRHDQLSM